ncbi:flagellar motor protein MotD [Nevskia ramosa]|uniref:flagellar motor protein MotD n=1 Tax=Nevskia ramosa TaxID=64002 RepID=UPI0003B6B91F|nr:flagellar motor protein MotD [Nevskia ramosa]
MARKRGHEEHANHEAWAIPYGDLVTLLLALFVVLYSMSSVNEGKYRVLSDSLNEAFGGKPRAAQPIQIGDQPPRGDKPALIKPLPKMTTPPLKVLSTGKPAGELQLMADQVHKAMVDLIDKNLIRVRRTELALEIEIGTDILFASGVADVSTAARPVLARLAAILEPFPNSIRVEGHTDDLPIATVAYPSNWQLSSARAASVVALFMGQGIAPVRMSVAGFGEYRPLASNDSADGRNRNRRVLIVIPRTEPPTITAAFDDGDASDPTATPLAQQLAPAIDRAIEFGSARPKADQDLAAATLAPASETSR